MHQCVVHREYNGFFRYESGVQKFFCFSNYVTESVPKQLLECELTLANQTDKLFSSSWVGMNQICAGSKDNKLIVWDLRKQPCLPSFIDLPSGENPPLEIKCGQHAIKTNASSTVLACGASNEAEIAILALPTFETITVLSGHTDWVFGLDFLTDDVIVSGSRDSTIKMWQIQKDSPTKINRPIISAKAHSSKTRDVVTCRIKKKIFSLGTEGEVKEWDAESFSTIRNIALQDKNEVVCLAYSQERGILTVGSQDCLTLIDTRIPRPINRVPSQDSDWGVRSLCWRDFIISAGCGGGKISFYDIRYNKYMELRNGKCYLKTGKGFLIRDETYNTHFRGVEVPQAAYTHCYDPTGLRLFVGGGPLNFGLKGAYAALW